MKKVIYKFVNGEHKEIEVNDEIANCIAEFEKAERANDERERYHRAYSINQYDYSGTDVSSLKDEPSQVLESKAYCGHINACLSHLSKTQQRRLLLLSEGLTVAEIARREGVAFNVVKESIEAARKKFLKYF